MRRELLGVGLCAEMPPQTANLHKEGVKAAFRNVAYPRSRLVGGDHLGEGSNAVADVVVGQAAEAQAHAPRTPLRVD